MLVGKKVQLTEIRPEDKALLLTWINDPKLVRQHGPYRPICATSHDEWFASIGNDRAHLHFAIREVGNDAIVGLLQLLHLHELFRSIELTVRLGSEAHRGRGLGVEAVKLATQFAFQDLNLHRVYLYVFADNLLAAKAYENAGFSIEGQLRDAAYIDGQWRDVLVMACVRGSD
ncbi:MAG: N-acetyltransferase [Methyloceanibacter sp.]|nr:MAG: N-acetyltransferase [Methyloceanibacter sp.]